MSEKVTPLLFVCNATGCSFSGPEVSENTRDKPYGVVSAKPGEQAKCPVCGGSCTTIEDGRHKFLRLNSMRVFAVVEKMRLIGNTTTGAQYEPTVDDLEKVRTVLFATFDRVSGQLDRKIERIKNPGETGKRTKSAPKRRTFAL